MQPWGRLRLPQHRIVLGVPQTGKTTFARRLASPAARLVVFDPPGDWEDLRLARVVAPSDLPAVLPPVVAGRHPAMCRIVVKAGRDEDYDIGDELVHVVRACKRAEDVLLVCDEVSLYNRGKAARALGHLHMNGHKWGIVTILVSQRAVGIPLDCRATATHVHSFLQDSEEDLTTLREVYDPGCPGFSERVRAWKPGEPPVTWSRRRLYQ